jgi:hypothetical protein
MSVTISTLSQLLMEFPSEIEAYIKQFAQPRGATLRPNWREGSVTIKAMKDNDNLISYHLYLQWLVERQERRRRRFRLHVGLPAGRRGGMEKWSQHGNRTFSQWCRWNNILVPLRSHLNCNCCLFGTCVHGWEQGVPDWAKEEYLAAK